MASYIEDKLAKEVKQVETHIVKYLIDYRCDETTRNVLQTFKQLVSTNRLMFTAGNVFRLDYGMILGTIINIITYSIILIQLFLSEPPKAT
ncbi:uncharacterized protein LOC119190059 [Manduca sexta]|uniref:uncharacterized protein LOC119190059 n=1 Tax=Manduca sexta TaxID=7130 RepID=UPI00188EDBC7|nr:uncharacterized protein LOC119190059 [Manduca sexta]